MNSSRFPAWSLHGLLVTRTSMLVKSYQSSSVMTQGRFARDIPPCLYHRLVTTFYGSSMLLNKNTSEHRGCLAWNTRCYDYANILRLYQHACMERTRAPSMATITIIITIIITTLDITIDINNTTSISTITIALTRPRYPDRVANQMLRELGDKAAITWYDIS